MKRRETTGAREPLPGRPLTAFKASLLPVSLTSNIKLSAGLLAAIPIVYGGTNMSFQNKEWRHCGTGAAARLRRAKRAADNLPGG